MPTYEMNSNNEVFAGRFKVSADPMLDMLDMLAAMPNNSWHQIPLATSFTESWVETELRPPYLSAKASPVAIIRAWGCIAYDTSRRQLVLWGGGHANTSDNTPYIFDMTTGIYSYAYLPSDYVTLGTGLHTPICGGFRQPNSSHCYDNNLYLPILDKFCTFGGAQHGDGGAFKLYDSSNGYSYLRLAGAYLLDTAAAGQNLVAGGTGDNPKTGAFTGVNIAGANAWQLRDWFGTGQASVFGSENTLTNGKTAYREEAGRDVVYAARSASGNKSLYRIEFHQDQSNDVITKVGRGFNGNSGSLSGGLDTQRNIFVQGNSGTTAAFVFWDLDYSGPTNNDKRVRYDSINGDITEYLNDIHNGMMAPDFDRQLNKFVLWGNGGTLYYLTPPDQKPTLTTGWHIEKVEPTGASRPMTAAELSASGGGGVGVYGKWEYAPDLRCFIGLQHAQLGNVWLYKPRNWTDPRI
ncbi:hypothetical protein VT06_04240 [Arsukibacterium sp. MJ3]|uniref:hypothetical protein n=1 Tax=Arsukibacterium sp. MJ3 TaxID=1632859 RepID=UPI000626FB5C|nr:hypothetical protein [Arsukibacterium sp. MJ3]KKO49811.1 hypothetical protein VT06_04240 [Arsukibacterium sp. MJ3]